MNNREKHLKFLKLKLWAKRRARYLDKKIVYSVSRAWIPASQERHRKFIIQHRFE